MKTSNLITDFLIIGIICIVTFTVPYFMINIEVLKSLFRYKIENPTFLIAILTVFTYIIGILFYQISDYGIKFFGKILRINEIKIEKDKIKETLDIDYHDALQKIVIKSKNSFDYLSYRRTIIRVIRAIFFSSFIFVILHLLYSIILCLSGFNLVFSMINLLILIAIICLNIFCRFVYIKQYKGYFSAITIFNQLIKENEDEISD